MGWRFGLGGLLCLVVVGMGCDKDKPAPSPGTSDPAAVLSAPASASALASSSASAELPAADPASAKKWTGTYESKPVALQTPEKVKDFTWKDDDGSRAVGKGQLTMTVTNNVITGDATGPLGPQKLTGVLDDGIFRLELVPSDPTAATAMAGSGTGELKDGVISGTLRCSGPKAVVVREVTFSLEPAK